MRNQSSKACISQYLLTIEIAKQRKRYNKQTDVNIFS